MKSTTRPLATGPVLLRGAAGRIDAAGVTAGAGNHSQLPTELMVRSARVR